MKNLMDDVNDLDGLESKNGEVSVSPPDAITTEGQISPSGTMNEKSAAGLTDSEEEIRKVEVPMTAKKSCTDRIVLTSSDETVSGFLTKFMEVSGKDLLFSGGDDVRIQDTWYVLSVPSSMLKKVMKPFKKKHDLIRAYFRSAKNCVIMETDLSKLLSKKIVRSIIPSKDTLPELKKVIEDEFNNHTFWSKKHKNLDDSIPIKVTFFPSAKKAEDIEKGLIVTFIEDAIEIMPVVQKGVSVCIITDSFDTLSVLAVLCLPKPKVKPEVIVKEVSEGVVDEEEEEDIEIEAEVDEEDEPEEGRGIPVKPRK